MAIKGSMSTFPRSGQSRCFSNSHLPPMHCSFGTLCCFLQLVSGEDHLGKGTLTIPRMAKCSTMQSKPYEYSHEHGAVLNSSQEQFCDCYVKA